MKIIEEIDVDTMPQTAIDIFRKHDTSVATKMMLPIRMMFPKLILPFHRRISTDSATAYENDGNTQCPGTRYDFLWTVPINREFGTVHNEWMDWHYNGGDCAMYFNLDFKLRNSDNKINYQPTLYLSVAPMRLDTGKKNNGNRIESFVHKRGLTRIGLFIKQILQEQEMLAIAKDAITQSEET